MNTLTFMFEGLKKLVKDGTITLPSIYDRNHVTMCVKDDACFEFGYRFGDLVEAPEELVGMVIGVFDKKLWFWFHHNDGVSNFGYYTYPDFADEGFFLKKRLKMEEDVVKVQTEVQTQVQPEPKEDLHCEVELDQMLFDTYNKIFRRRDNGNFNVKTKSGDHIELITKLCPRFGFECGNVVLTPRGQAIMCGVDSIGDLWFLVDMDRGATSWKGFKEEDYKQKGFVIVDSKKNVPVDSKEADYSDSDSSDTSFSDEDM